MTSQAQYFLLFHLISIPFWTLFYHFPYLDAIALVHGVDLVFDMVGGDTLQRSWQVIKPGGVLVSIVSPPPSAAVAKGHDVRFVWFVVEPNRDELIQISALIDAGQLRPIIDTVFPLAQARQAYEQAAKGHTRGKRVLRVMES